LLLNRNNNRNNKREVNINHQVDVCFEKVIYYNLSNPSTDYSTLQGHLQPHI